MIEISFGKLLVLALIALVVLGPEKLPQAARTAGALVRRLRSSWDSVRAEVERELQVEEIRRTARESVARMDAAQAELDATLKQVRAVASGAADSGGTSPPAAVAPVGGGRPDDHPKDPAAAAEQPALAAASAAAIGTHATAAADHPAVTAAGAAAAASNQVAPADASAPSADTRTGDLFAGTASAAPPAAATTAAPAERIDGTV